MIISTYKLIDENGNVLAEWMDRGTEIAIMRAEDEIEKIHGNKINEIILIQKMTYNTKTGITRYKEKEIERWKKENKNSTQPI